LISAVLLCLCGSACGEALGADSKMEFSARVIAVLDGDTVLILRKCVGAAGGLVKIRLAEIDAPEKKQAFGAASRSSLVEMVWRKQIQVRPLALDKYGRTVAQLEVNGLSVNEEMVRRGMAWEYSHYHSDRRYISIENEARQAGRGLWAQSDPVPPWQWRLRHVTGEASRLREPPPAAASTAEPPTGELRRRKRHAADTAMPLALAPGDYSCGSKQHCSQMHSCDEAHYYLTVCGVKALNPKGDGIPCEKLCARGR
jgi:micrococcal nuclease